MNKHLRTNHKPIDPRDPIVQAARFSLSVLVCTLLLFWATVGPLPAASTTHHQTAGETCA